MSMGINIIKYIILNMSTILFIRHPTCSHNSNRVWCSRTDVEIPYSSNNQIENLLKEIKPIKINKIFTSPKKRAFILAEKIAQLVDTKLEISDLLLERDFGELEMTNEIDGQKEEMSDWSLNSDLNKNVEKIQDMYLKRIKPFLNDLIRDDENKTYLIVSHSWVGRLINFYFNGEKQEALTYSPKNCHIYKYLT